MGGEHDKFYAISCGEDGVAIQEFQSWDAAKKELDPGGSFLAKVPPMDKGYFMGVGDYATLLIRGRIVVPTPKTTITELSEPH